MGKSRFDPAEHLAKQGWKGKGTALKEGHATRHLAVVQKTTLSGIGKDRDEAIPFWDQIFAATAATLFPTDPSSSSSSPAPTVGLPTHLAHSTTRSWVTTSYSPDGSASPNPASGSNLSRQPNGRGMSLAARTSKELARRGLYSRFFRGAVLSQESTPDVEEVEEGLKSPESSGGSSAGDAGPSRLTLTSSDPKGSTKVSGNGEPNKSKKGKERSKGEEKKESKEERKARKAEKAQRKIEKEERRKAKEERDSAKVASISKSEVTENEDGIKKSKKRKAEPMINDSEHGRGVQGSIDDSTIQTAELRKKSRKNREKNDLGEDKLSAGSSVDSDLKKEVEKAVSTKGEEKKRKKKGKKKK